MITGGIGLSNLELTLIVCLALLLLTLLAFIINKCCTNVKYESLPSDQQQDLGVLQGDYDKLNKACKKLEQEHKQLKSKYNDLKLAYGNAENLLVKLKSDLRSLQSDYDKLNSQHLGLQKDTEERSVVFLAKYETLLNSVKELIKLENEECDNILQSADSLIKLRRVQAEKKLDKPKFGRSHLKEVLTCELMMLQGALNNVIRSSNDKFNREAGKVITVLSNIVVESGTSTQQHGGCVVNKAA